MKAMSSKIIKSLQVGSTVNCVDNSGADTIEIIAVKVYKGVKRRKPRCGIGDVVVAAVKKGNEKMRHEVVEAVIVRQKKEYRRRNGLHIRFEDNAAVLVNERGEARGTRLKGPVAKEAVERFSSIGKIATIVV